MAGAGLLTRLQPRLITPALTWNLSLRLTLIPTRALSLTLTRMQPKLRFLSFGLQLRARRRAIFGDDDDEEEEEEGGTAVW